MIWFNDFFDLQLEMFGFYYNFVTLSLLLSMSPPLLPLINALRVFDQPLLRVVSVQCSTIVASFWRVVTSKGMTEPETR